MIGISIIVAAIIIADAYVVVHGYEPWIVTWKKKYEKESKED